METMPLPPLMLHIPTKNELQFDINAMQADAKARPEDAELDKLREEIYQKYLEVLNDPKNAGIDPNTRAGAENLWQQMTSETQGLSDQAYNLLTESLENGQTYLLADGIPNDPNPADRGTWIPI